MFGLNATAQVQNDVKTVGCERCKPKILPQEDAVYKKMAHIAKKTERALKHVSADKDIVKTLEARSLCAKQVALFPKAPNFLTEISPNADVITFENGAAWSIAEKHQALAQSWDTGAPLVITPNQLSLWSKLTKKGLKHKYRLVNLETNKYVEANLSLGPYAHNPYTLKIRKINTKTGEVSFTNGTLWRVDNSAVSSALLRDWEVGDYVMTGSNNTWFGLGLPEIVVNVTSDNWLPAQRLY